MGTETAKRQPLKTFFPLMDGELRMWDTQQMFGISPTEYQEILHAKAAWLREKFQMLVKVRSQIEGSQIIFRVIVDGD